MFHSRNLLPVREKYQEMHLHSKTKSNWESLKAQLLESEKWMDNQHYLDYIRGCFSNPGDGSGEVHSCDDEKSTQL